MRDLRSILTSLHKIESGLMPRNAPHDQARAMFSSVHDIESGLLPLNEDEDEAEEDGRFNALIGAGMDPSEYQRLYGISKNQFNKLKGLEQKQEFLTARVTQLKTKVEGAEKASDTAQKTAAEAVRAALLTSAATTDAENDTVAQRQTEVMLSQTLLFALEQLVQLEEKPESAEKAAEMKTLKQQILLSTTNAEKQSEIVTAADSLSTQTADQHVEAATAQRDKAEDELSMLAEYIAAKELLVEMLEKTPSLQAQYTTEISEGRALILVLQDDTLSKSRQQEAEEILRNATANVQAVNESKRAADAARVVAKKKEQLLQTDILKDYAELMDQRISVQEYQRLFGISGTQFKTMNETERSEFLNKRVQDLNSAGVQAKQEVLKTEATIQDTILHTQTTQKKSSDDEVAATAARVAEIAGIKNLVSTLQYFLSLPKETSDLDRKKVDQRVLLAQQRHEKLEQEVQQIELQSEQAAAAWLHAATQQQAIAAAIVDGRDKYIAVEQLLLDVLQTEVLIRTNRTKIQKQNILISHLNVLRTQDITNKQQTEAGVQTATQDVRKVAEATALADNVRRAENATLRDLKARYVAEMDKDNTKILDATLQPLIEEMKKTSAVETARVAAVEAARVAAESVETTRVKAEVELARDVALDAETKRDAIDGDVKKQRDDAMQEVQNVLVRVEAVRAAAEVAVVDVEQVLAKDTQDAASIADAVKQALDTATAKAQATHVAAQAEAKRVAAEVEDARLAAEVDAERIAIENKSKIPPDADAATVEAARIAAYVQSARVAAEVSTTRVAAEVASARVAAEVDAARVAAEVEAKRLKIQHETTRLAVEEVVDDKRFDAQETAIRVAFVANAAHHSATLQDSYLVAVATANVKEAACETAKVKIALATANAKAALLSADYTAQCIAIASDSEFLAAEIKLELDCLQINIERIKNPGNDTVYNKQLKDANRLSDETNVTKTTEIAAALKIALAQAVRVANFVKAQHLALQNDGGAVEFVLAAQDARNAAHDALQKANKASAAATAARDDTVGLAQVQDDKRKRDILAKDVATSAADAAREAADEAVENAELAAKNVAAEVVRAAAAAADLESIRVSAETAAEDVLVQAAEEEVRLKAVAQEALAKAEAAAAAASAAVVSAGAVDTSVLDAEGVKIAADTLRIAKVMERVDTEMTKQITVLTKAFKTKMKTKNESNRDNLDTCTTMNRKNQELQPSLDKNIRDDARLAKEHVKCQQELAIMTSKLTALQTISSRAKEEYEDEACTLHLYTEAQANCRKIEREIINFQGKLEAAQKESQNANRSFESTRKRVKDGETRLITQLTEFKKEAATTSGVSEHAHTASSAKVSASDKLCKDITLQDDVNLYKNTLQYRITVVEEGFAKEAHDTDKRHVDAITKYEKKIIQEMDETRKITNANSFDIHTAATDEEDRFKKQLEKQEQDFIEQTKKQMQDYENRAGSARRLEEMQAKMKQDAHLDTVPKKKTDQLHPSNTQAIDRIESNEEDKKRTVEEDKQYEKLEENTRKAEEEMDRFRIKHVEAMRHTSDMENQHGGLSDKREKAKTAEDKSRADLERARKAYFDAYHLQIASQKGKRLSARDDTRRRHEHLHTSPNSEADPRKVHAAFISSILSLAIALVERVYPPTPADPARTRPAFARHARADPRIAASVAHAELHALCARIAHIAELAHAANLPHVAALRFVLEIPENSRLVSRATAPRPSGSPYAARAVQAPDHKNIVAIRECLHKTKLQHVRRDAEAFLKLALQHRLRTSESDDSDWLQYEKQHAQEQVHEDVRGTQV